MTDLRQLIAEKLFDEPQKCSGHCNQPSTAKFLETGSHTKELVAYSCYAGYLSMLALYGEDLDLPSAESFIRGAVGPDQDVRIATRYASDLGTSGPSPRSNEKVMRVAYWRQNYRGRKVDDPDRAALFLCGRCQSVFSQPLMSRLVLCQNCREKP